MAIDAGDPADDHSNEPQPSEHINMGAYGNTAEATIITNRGGTLTANTTWIEDTYVSGDITIPVNKTLTINPGIDVTFIDDYDAQATGNTLRSEIIVNGTLNINGNSSQPVNLTSYATSPSKGDWQGVIVKSGGTLNADYATVEYGYYGVKYESGSAGFFTNGTIKDNSYGLHIYGSNPQIGYNLISNNSNGIKVYNSYSTPNWNTIHFEGNTVSGNTTYGLYLSNSSPTFSGNTFSNNYRSAFWSGSNPILNGNYFTGNTHYGVAFFGNCSPSMYKNGAFGGYNTISGNGAQGIRITSSSNPNMGILNPSAGGYNSIYGNSGYEIDNTGSNSIYASHNWWGSAAGPSLNDINGSIYWSPPLSYDPNSSSSSSVEGQLSLSKTGVDEFVFNPDLDLPEKMQRGYFEQSVRNYSAAADSFKNQFVKIKEDKYNPHSVIQYVKSLSFLMRPKDVKKNITTILKEDLDKNSRYELLLLSSNQNIFIKDNKSALSDLDDALELGVDQDQENLVNIQKAMIYKYELNDKVNAEKYFKLVQANSEKGSDEYILAAEELADIKNSLSKNNADNSHSQEDVTLPQKFKLLGNYPNPFNPTTQIRFELPEISDIRIDIFNIQGQFIKTIKRESVNAGQSQITWKGKNSFGNSVASGLYIYRFSARSLKNKSTVYIKSSKMLLLR